MSGCMICVWEIERKDERDTEEEERGRERGGVGTMGLEAWIYVNACLSMHDGSTDLIELGGIGVLIDIFLACRIGGPTDKLCHLTPGPAYM